MIVRAEAVDAGKRLDAFLHEKLPSFSRSRLQGWIKKGHVVVDGAAVRVAYLIRGAETIDVRPAKLEPLKAQAEELPLEILYQDADVVAINKPAGMVVHSGAGHDSGTLVNALLHHFEHLSNVNGDERPGIVHRLDKDTSGVLLVARTDEAHRLLAAQFQDREVEKIYLAVVHGKLRHMQGRITTPINRDPVRRTRMTAKIGTGRNALTEYTVLEEFERFTLLQVRIGTGRTHQIRVHLSSIGHPVAGDRLYGAPVQPGLVRFLLHAHRVRFRSPSTEEWITVESPLPVDFREAVERYRGNVVKIGTSR